LHSRFRPLGRKIGECDVGSSQAQVQIYRRRRSIGREYLYILPAVALLGFFLAYPIVYNFRISLFNWNGIAPKQLWVGLGNYLSISTSKSFLNAMKNTLLFTVAAAVFQTAVGLLLAVCISQVNRFQTVYRTLLFAPVVMSIVAVSFIWTWMYNPSFGMVNNLLNALGILKVNIAWLGDGRTALGAILVASIWKWAGFTMVVYIAGIENIPWELYECATLEGAGRFRQFIFITFPLTISQTFINVLLTTIGSLKVFDWVFIMTAGGPGRSTEVLPYVIYSDAFRFHRIGYSASEATVLFLMIIILSYFIMRLFKGFDITKKGKAKG
jgi:raffinose/stachyose/melibiose transport system permease protein